jgi:hypothetical protein
VAVWQGSANAPTPSPSGGFLIAADRPVAAVQPTSAADLLARCHQLRASHRCPGRCVFTGELRRSSRDALRGVADEL